MKGLQISRAQGLTIQFYNSYQNLKTLCTINTNTNLDNIGTQASKQFEAYVLAKQGWQKVYLVILIYF